MFAQISKNYREGLFKLTKKYKSGGTSVSSPTYERGGTQGFRGITYLGSGQISSCLVAMSPILLAAKKSSSHRFCAQATRSRLNKQGRRSVFWIGSGYKRRPEAPTWSLEESSHRKFWNLKARKGYFRYLISYFALEIWRALAPPNPPPHPTPPYLMSSVYLISNTTKSTF